MKNVVVRRPWGEYVVILKGTNYLLKCIRVDANMRTSLQRHKHRAEHWRVVHGSGCAALDDRIVSLKENSTLAIPVMATHRIAASPGEDLWLLEIQFGDILSEDDIERLDDDHGRV